MRLNQVNHKPNIRRVTFWTRAASIVGEEGMSELLGLGRGLPVSGLKVCVTSVRTSSVESTERALPVSGL